MVILKEYTKYLAVKDIMPAIIFKYFRYILRETKVKQLD